MKPGWRVLLLILLLTPLAAAQEVPGGGGGPSREAADLYRRLGSVGLDPSRIYRIREARLDREDLHFSFNQGVIGFTQAVDGRITGAFFVGDGEVLLAPPDRVERQSLARFTGAAILEEHITSAYLRFNDDTFAELQPSLRPFEAQPELPEPEGTPMEPDEPAEKSEPQPATPQEFVAKWDSAARSLAQLSALRLLLTFIDAETPAADGTPRWTQPANDRILHARVASAHLGVFDIYFDTRANEQLTVAQHSDVAGLGYYNIWTSFPMRSARAQVPATNSGAPPTATAQTQAAAENVPSVVTVFRYTIRARIEPPRQLQAEATLDLESSEAGHRMLLFELSRFLRVKEVTLDGKAIEFVQNEALEGSELRRRGNDLVGVIFPRALVRQQRVQLRFSYGGEVLSEAGGGLMYVGARGIWYPNRGLAMSDFDLEFRYPAPWTLVATGKRVSDKEVANADGSGTEQVTRFVSERPIPIAGFNLGQYVKAEAKAGKVAVETYAARGVESNFPRQQSTIIADEQVDPLTGRRLSSLRALPPPPPTPAENAKQVANQTAQTVNFLASRFGPYPYSTLAVTQMPGSTSQGWPGMVYLSSYVFLTPEERARSRISGYREVLFGRIMPAHETAHQWWGDLLMWQSYREQWLVEALSNYSALMMLETQDPPAFRTAMEEYRQRLLQKEGEHAVTEAGPVTLGMRLDSSRFPDAYETIAYGRGTWLFHMLHHMLIDAGGPGGGRAARPGADDPFISALRGLRQRFEGRSITTRDVQQAFEDVLPESLRYEGHKSLEWFFDSWVNGTAIPRLRLNSVKLSPRGEGMTASGYILQTDAPKDLVTSVPIYADTGRSKPVLLGRVFAEGPDTPFRFSAPAGTRKLLLDPYQTVLTRP